MGDQTMNGMPKLRGIRRGDLKPSSLPEAQRREGSLSADGEILSTKYVGRLSGANPPCEMDGFPFRYSHDCWSSSPESACPFGRICAASREER